MVVTHEFQPEINMSSLVEQRENVASRDWGHLRISGWLRYHPEHITRGTIPDL